MNRCGIRRMQRPGSRLGCVRGLKPTCIQAIPRPFWPMGSPTTPLTLTVEQMEELHKKLSTVRHDVNNHLSLIVAAVELIKCNADMVPRMTAMLAEQPAKISNELNKFAAEFEKILGITHTKPS